MSQGKDGFFLQAVRRRSQKEHRQALPGRTFDEMPHAVAM
jgi:hypothetical protein